MSKPKIKPNIKISTRKIPVYEVGGMSTLKTKSYYDFFRTHKQPSRLPIINKIRATMIEKEDEIDNVYYQLEDKGINKKRILDTLSGKRPEKVVYNTLCEILGIPLGTSLSDYVANYDFELKPICHKIGRKSTQTKLEFLHEFRKSWSIETVNSYLGEYDDNELCYTTDEEISQMEAKDMKEMCDKFRDICIEYPEMAKTFCDSFRYEND